MTKKSSGELMEIPTLTVDLDKKCSQCNKPGSCQNGLCMDCITKAITLPAKSMMLNQRNFEIAKLASKDEDASDAVRGILVSPDKTVVTDGRILLEVTGFEHAGDMLPFDDLTPQPDFVPFIMPAEEALALSKVFVKSESSEANLIAIQPNNGTGQSSFGLRQPKAEKVFRVEKPKGNYPNYEAVFPPISEEAGSVTVNLDLLIPLLQQIKKVFPFVRIGYYGPDKPLRFDCNDPDVRQSVRACIMPMAV
jgi:hypothetical protein